MTISRSEDLFVGIVALALVPWTAWTIICGIRDARLPLGRSYVGRDRPAAFNLLLAFYVVAGLMAAMISADLLLNFDIRNAV